MLVSLHLPKTAGTSFLALLESHFNEQLLRDYSDRPLNRDGWRRRSRALRACIRYALPPSGLEAYQCIHGHFMPLKYRLLPPRREVRFIAWFRDPVERLASHYHYWQRSYNPLDAGSLHRRVVEERWDLERFCLGPELQNTYSKFLWGFPLARFDFVGITEYYAEDVGVFARRFLGSEPVAAAHSANVNQLHRPPDSSGAAEPYILEPALRRAVEAHHAQDIALYQAALALRAARSHA
jgi:hypothetical protein